MNSVKANEEDEEKIQKAQMGMTMGRPDIVGDLGRRYGRFHADRGRQRRRYGRCHGLHGHEYGRSGRRRPGTGTGGPSTGAANVAVTGSAGKCSGTRRWLDLFLRSNRQYGKILHELWKTETGTHRSLDLPVLWPQRQRRKVLHQLRSAETGVFRLDLPVVRYGQHGEILHELRNEEA